MNIIVNGLFVGYKQPNINHKIEMITLTILMLFILTRKLIGLLTSCVK